MLPGISYYFDLEVLHYRIAFEEAAIVIRPLKRLSCTEEKKALHLRIVPLARSSNDCLRIYVRGLCVLSAIGLSGPNEIRRVLISLVMDSKDVIVGSGTRTRASMFGYMRCL